MLQSEPIQKSLFFGGEISNSSPEPKPKKALYTDLSPKNLLKKVEGLTSIQAREASEPFTNLRISRKVTISNIRELSKQEYLVHCNDVEDESFISGVFDHEWKNRVPKLRQNEEIQIDGKISSLSRSGILSLADCKIMVSKLAPDL